MLRFTLTFQFTKNPLCPCCLEELNHANVVFVAGTAICATCNASEFDDCVVMCLHVLRYGLRGHHKSTHRGITFFTPRDRVPCGLQLLEAHPDRARFLTDDDGPGWIPDPEREQVHDMSAKRSTKPDNGEAAR